jgi:hypothetical protein
VKVFLPLTSPFYFELKRSMRMSGISNIRVLNFNRKRRKTKKHAVLLSENKCQTFTFSELRLLR